VWHTGRGLCSGKVCRVGRASYADRGGNTSAASSTTAGRRAACRWIEALTRASIDRSVLEATAQLPPIRRFAPLPVTDAMGGGACSALGTSNGSRIPARGITQFVRTLYATCGGSRQPLNAVLSSQSSACQQRCCSWDWLSLKSGALCLRVQHAMFGGQAPVKAHTAVLSSCCHFAFESEDY
jgi:hypothetical protein